jgi:hypothetical protein
MIVRGSLERLTPVLMTALVAAFALAPLLFEAEQPGTEILHPVAVVIFSGLVSSTLLDTFLTPPCSGCSAAKRRNACSPKVATRRFDFFQESDHANQKSTFDYRSAVRPEPADRSLAHADHGQPQFGGVCGRSWRGAI